MAQQLVLPLDSAAPEIPAAQTQDVTTTQKNSNFWWLERPCRIAFTGSRDWSDVEPIRRLLRRIVPGSTVLVGDCRGLDAIVAREARAAGFEPVVFRADWSKGLKAGPERNRKMMKAGPDVVLAFPLGPSHGTRDAMSAARARDIEVVNMSELLKKRLRRREA